MNELPKLEKDISKRAINVWRLSNLMIGVFFYSIIVGLMWTSYYFDWYQWMTVILRIFIIVLPFAMVWSLYYEPKIKQKHWKYGVNEQFVHLKHGKLFTHETVIPMTKVQYVEAEQGPLLRKYGLYTLTIGTLGDKHTIPALPAQETFALREKIANHARLKEVES